VSGIQVVDLGAAEVVSQPTFVSRRLIRQAHGSHGASFNVTTLHEGYDDPAVSYPDHDEIVYILSGTVELTIAGETRTVGAGTGFYVPRGERYGYKVVRGPNEVIAVFTPAKF
jgi:quercetin dioxygenase-like cupin family protein